MTNTQYAHCTYCGAAFPTQAGWPRTCAECGNTTFRNPIPVAVVLVPIEREAGGKGLLVVRRAIPPRSGQLAIPGGYVNYGETWQEAGAREVFEESGLQIDPAEIREFRVRSAPDGSLIIFGLATHLRHEQDLPAFQPNEEASERRVLSAPEPLAFGLHSEMAEVFFKNTGLPIAPFGDDR